MLQVSSSAERQQTVCKERGGVSHLLVIHTATVKWCSPVACLLTVGPFGPPPPDQTPPQKPLLQRLYIHLCAITRLNIVIVLIYWAIYTHSVLCSIWYTQIMYSSKINIRIPWKHSLTYDRLWDDPGNKIVVVVKWALYVCINIADVQNHQNLNKEWHVRHLSTYIQTDMEATYVWDYTFFSLFLYGEPCPNRLRWL